jgi:hypothetical protein
MALDGDPTRAVSADDVFAEIRTLHRDALESLMSLP